MTILLAEDDVTSRTALAGVLEARGHTVWETLNGNQAWQALQQPDAPRLVILDWMMPGIDGPELLRRVRARASELPPYIIMLTARVDKSDIIAGLAAGANDYLVKPFDPGELFARLDAGQRMVELQDALVAKAEALRRTQVDLRVLTTRMQAVREEERAMLSRELHDSFGPHLTALQLDLMWMDRHLHGHKPPDLAVLADRIVAMVPLVERLTEQTQTLCASLRPSVLYELGLVAAIEWQAEDTAKRSGLQCSTRVPPADVELDQDLALALYRIVQEALTNVLRHAQASQVEVSLEMGHDSLVLEVRDNGQGYPQGSTTGSKALGLLGIRERVSTVGGKVDFFNLPDMGAAVRVVVPIKTGQAAEIPPEDKV